MQKKIIALAVAGLVSGGAFAQANVTAYGRANTGLDNYSATGSLAGATQDFKGRTRVFDSGSRLGFRGTEDLGGGLKANFVVEAGVNMDTGTGNGQSGAANGSTGSFASRDSYMGLGGNWGEVRFGRQSLYWGDGVLNQTGANYINAATTLSTGVTTGMVSGPTNRTSNTMLYLSPSFSGFQFQGAMATTQDGTAVNTNTNGQIYSFRLTYGNGPVNVLADYTVNNGADLLAVTGRTKNTGTKLGAGFMYGAGSQIALIWTKHVNNNIAAAITPLVGANIANAGDDLSQNTWTINWEHTMGNAQLFAQYARGGNVTGMTGTTTGDSSIRSIMLGAKYNFSKRTGVYVSWNQINNGDLNYADYGGGGYTSAAGGALGVNQRGADPQVLGIGIMHNF